MLCFGPPVFWLILVFCGLPSSLSPAYQPSTWASICSCPMFLWMFLSIHLAFKFLLKLLNPTCFEKGVTFWLDWVYRLCALSKLWSPTWYVMVTVLVPCFRKWSSANSLTGHRQVKSHSPFCWSPLWFFQPQFSTWDSLFHSKGWCSRSPYPGPRPVEKKCLETIY